MNLDELTTQLGQIDFANRGGRSPSPSTILCEQLEAKGIAKPKTKDDWYKTLTNQTNDMLNYLPHRKNGRPYALNSLTRKDILVYANTYARLVELKNAAQNPIFKTDLIVEHVCSFLDLREGFSIAWTNKLTASTIASQSSLCRVLFVQRRRDLYPQQLQDLFESEHTRDIFDGHSAEHLGYQSCRSAALHGPLVGAIDVRSILIVPFGGTVHMHGNVIIRVVKESWVDIFSKRSVHMSTESQDWQEAATEAKMKIKNALYQMPSTQEKYYLVNVEFQEIHSEDYYRPPLFKVEIWAIYAIDVDESEQDDDSKLL
jgi:hypothetical protein